MLSLSGVLHDRQPCGNVVVTPLVPWSPVWPQALLEAGGILWPGSWSGTSTPAHRERPEPRDHARHRLQPWVTLDTGLHALPGLQRTAQDFQSDSVRTHTAFPHRLLLLSVQLHTSLKCRARCSGTSHSASCREPGMPSGSEPCVRPRRGSSRVGQSRADRSRAALTHRLAAL